MQNRKEQEQQQQQRENQNQTITGRMSEPYTTMGDQKTKWTCSKNRGGDVWGFQWSGQQYMRSWKLLLSRMWPDALLVTIHNLTLVWEGLWLRRSQIRQHGRCCGIMVNWFEELLWKWQRGECTDRRAGISSVLFVSWCEEEAGRRAVSLLPLHGAFLILESTFGLRQPVRLVGGGHGNVSLDVSHGGLSGRMMRCVAG